MPVAIKYRTKTDPGERKFREAILYLSEKSQGDETFGATKLNKLLFYSDFLAYLNFGKAITGEKYFRLKNGPAPRRLLPIKQRLEAEGAIKVESVQFYGFPQNRVIPLRKPDYEVFESREIALMNKLIEIHKGKTASEISDESHGFIGWILASDKEDIPYSVARAHNRALNDKERRHAGSLAARAAALTNNDEQRAEDNLCRT